MEVNTDKILKLVEIEYGISVSSIEKLNIGFDQNTKVYKLYSRSSDEYFLKIRFGVFNESSLTVPLWINNNIKPKNIIDPVKTISKKNFIKLTSLYIILYPFIHGQSGWDKALTNSQFIDLGKFLYNLHSIELPNEYIKLMPIEKYDSKFRENVKNILSNTNNNNDPLVIDFFNELYKKKDTIAKIVNEIEMLLCHEKKEPFKYCLCHGDIHAGNVLINEKSFFVIDWDTIILAPKEKDLMFIGGGIGNKWNKQEEIECFYTGYGKNVEINKNLVKYFRYERIMQDIFEFYHQITDNRTDERERELCVKYFKEQFEPNNVIDIALNTY